jgi:hypothetical protein
MFVFFLILEEVSNRGVVPWIRIEFRVPFFQDSTLLIRILDITQSIQQLTRLEMWG